MFFKFYAELFKHLSKPADLSVRILVGKKYVEKALDNLKTAMSREEKSVIEFTAIGTFLYNVYRGE